MLRVGSFSVVFGVTHALQRGAQTAEGETVLVGSGHSDCPCIGIHGVDGELNISIGDSLSSYPSDVGTSCDSWDDGRYTSACEEGGDPGKGKGWCAQKWCYVDPCNCEGVTPKKSTYGSKSSYQGKPLYYSYETCGSDDSFSSSLAAHKRGKKKEHKAKPAKKKAESSKGEEAPGDLTAEADVPENKASEDEAVQSKVAESGEESAKWKVASDSASGSDVKAKGDSTGSSDAWKSSEGASGWEKGNSAGSSKAQKSPEGASGKSGGGGGGGWGPWKKSGKNTAAVSGGDGKSGGGGGWGPWKKDGKNKGAVSGGDGKSGGGGGWGPWKKEGKNTAPVSGGGDGKSGDAWKPEQSGKNTKDAGDAAKANTAGQDWSGSGGEGNDKNGNMKKDTKGTSNQGAEWSKDSAQAGGADAWKPEGNTPSNKDSQGNGAVSDASWKHAEAESGDKSKDVSSEQGDGDTAPKDGKASSENDQSSEDNANKANQGEADSDGKQDGEKSDNKQDGEESEKSDKQQQKKKNDAEKAKHEVKKDGKKAADTVKKVAKKKTDVKKEEEAKAPWEYVKDQIMHKLKEVEKAVEDAVPLDADKDGNLTNAVKDGKISSGELAKPDESEAASAVKDAVADVAEKEETSDTSDAAEESTEDHKDEEAETDDEDFGPMCASKVDEKTFGKGGCMCIGIDQKKGGLMDVRIGDSASVYPADVGGSCSSWDQHVHPDCSADAEGSVPDWCQESWCYVDPCTCDQKMVRVDKKHAYMPKATADSKPLFYSYATCGSVDHWSAENNEAACSNKKTEDECKDDCVWAGKTCKDQTQMSICGTAETLQSGAMTLLGSKALAVIVVVFSAVM